MSITTFPPAKQKLPGDWIWWLPKFLGRPLRFANEHPAGLAAA